MTLYSLVKCSFLSGLIQRIFI